MATVIDRLSALELADRERNGTSATKPFRLWVWANLDAAGAREARLTLFRHAMIHAGFLLTSKGKPYKRCPMCHTSLPPTRERR